MLHSRLYCLCVYFPSAVTAFCYSFAIFRYIRLDTDFSATISRRAHKAMRCVRWNIDGFMSNDYKNKTKIPTKRESSKSREKATEDPFKTARRSNEEYIETPTASMLK